MCGKSSGSILAITSETTWPNWDVFGLVLKNIKSLGLNIAVHTIVYSVGIKALVEITLGRFS
jgi:hypothetical protein